MTDRTAKTIALASARKGLRRRQRQFTQRLRDLPWLAVNYTGLFKRLKATECYDGWAREFLCSAEEFKHIYRRFYFEERAFQQKFGITRQQAGIKPL
jgi:hypothetical protein